MKHAGRISAYAKAIVAMEDVERIECDAEGRCATSAVGADARTGVNGLPHLRSALGRLTPAAALHVDLARAEERGDSDEENRLLVLIAASGAARSGICSEEAAQ